MTKKCNKYTILFSIILCFNYTQAFSQVQWATQLIDFSSEYKDDLIRENSTRWSASQVLGFPNCLKYGSSQLAWTPKHQNNSKEFITVAFQTPQTVQQVIVGENFNAGAITEIILYDNKGKKYTVFESLNPRPTYKMGDVLTYFKIKPTYNVVKLKLVLSTNATIAREEIDCIGISSNTLPYVQNINVLKYSEAVGIPENLGPNVNSSNYDHLPLISPDGSKLYFTRKLSDENNLSAFDDDIYYSEIMPSGNFSKAINIGSPLNTTEHNFACYISADNNRLYVANKYVKNTYNFTGLSVSTKQKDNTWSKPKPLSIPELQNKNEFAHYYLNLAENVVLMSIQDNNSLGDLDLYVSQKYSDGNWTKPKNLGHIINTVGAEGSVFLAADSRTLYFSSTGHPGFGSYDMYMSKRLDDTWTNWSKPLNLGDKINTDEMDIYYTIPASGDYAYFSSGRTMYGMNDLYRIRLPKEIRPDFIDSKNLISIANTSPLKKTETTVATKVTTNTTPPTKNATATSSLKTTLPQNSQTDELQKKLDALKQQQAQVKPSTNEPKATTVNTTTAANTTPTVVTKREVINYIEPPKAPEKKPNVLTQEELVAREQQKTNPSINPNSDRLNSLTKNPMKETINQNVNLPKEAVITPTNNYKINEVEPVISTPNSVSNTSPTLATNTVPKDELQMKINDLKNQQSQARLNQPTSTTTTTSNTIPKTIEEQYPNPAPIQSTYNANTDQLQQKLEALKQQQYQTAQSTKMYSNPYEPKPYDAQPLKEREEDKTAQSYDEYQQKLNQLKQQQKNTTITSPSKSEIATIPVNTTVPKQDIKTVTTVPEVKQPQKTDKIISSYEEKLRKLKEELSTLNQPIATDNKLPIIAEKSKEIVPEKSNPKMETIVVNDEETKIAPIQEPSKIEPSKTTEWPSKTATLEIEQAKLDSIKQAQQIAEKNLTTKLDKMEAGKQSLENDISELKEQRTKFNEENEKLSSQNTQLVSEKEKLELEKKRMDDLLAKMQEERDKLAAEKQKIEQEKTKLDLVKKQQEKEFFAMKNAIDSIAKVQQNAAKNLELQQKYDLFNVPMEVGAVAIADRIFFVADGAYLTIPSYPEIDKVAEFLKKNINIKVEIGGHTNGLCDDAFCNKLSKDRAKTCVDYLVSKGIDKNRLSYKGYGKQHLISAPGSPLNQRVEIKILSVQ